MHAFAVRQGLQAGLDWFRDRRGVAHCGNRPKVVESADLVRVNLPSRVDPAAGRETSFPSPILSLNLDHSGGGGPGPSGKWLEGERQGNREGASSPHLRLHSDCATMLLRDTFHNGQPKPNPSAILGASRFRPIEPLEDLAELSAGYAAPFI